MTNSAEWLARVGVPSIVFLLLSSAISGESGKNRYNGPSEQVSFDGLLGWIAPQMSWEQANRRESQSHFDRDEVNRWKRFVVSIGTHEPLVGELSRTGFAVNNSGTKYGQQIVSANIDSLSSGIRLHTHPFHMPQSNHAQRGTVIQNGRLGLVRANGATVVETVQLSDLRTEYHRRFPVVVIGFVGDQPTCFYTHSDGIARRSYEIKLARRPPGAFGEFFGAPVFNTFGQVVGIYAPTNHEPTYITSNALRETP